MSANDNLRVAKTIKEQLMGMDYWALGAWGARAYKGMERSEENLGFLEFKVFNCPKVPNGTSVRITLEFNDTYTVKTYTVRKVKNKFEWKENVISEREDVYFDELVSHIDNVVG